MRPCLLPHKGVVSAGMQEQVSYVVPFAPEKPKRVIQCLAPRITVYPDLFHDRIGGTKIIPHDQIVFIVEEPIKRRGGEFTVIRDFLDRDFFDALFLRKLLQGLGKDFFRCFPFHLFDFLSENNYYYKYITRFQFFKAFSEKTSPASVGRKGFWRNGWDSQALNGDLTQAQ